MKYLFESKDCLALKSTLRGGNKSLSAVTIKRESLKVVCNGPEQIKDSLKVCNLLDHFEHHSALRHDFYQGPTDESNWVIPGHLLVGAYPSSLNDQQHLANIRGLLAEGVTTFVCLQEEYSHTKVMVEDWRRGLALRPYYWDALEISQTLRSEEPPPKKRHGSCSLRRPSPELDFLHFPIVDCSTADDNPLLDLCQDLANRLRQGEVLYVHCWGGHGRTGTVTSILLGMLYGMGAEEAMQRCQVLHDMRKRPVEVGSPQTDMQRKQVCRVLAQLKSTMNNLVREISPSIQRLKGQNGTSKQKGISTGNDNFSKLEEGREPTPTKESSDGAGCNQEPCKHRTEEEINGKKRQRCADCC